MTRDTKKSFDCVAMKRRAQCDLNMELAGQPLGEQVATFSRMAASTPLWKNLVKAQGQRSKQSARNRSPRRSAG